MKFDSKFSTICEDTIYRYQTGGFLSGDIVKFRKGALKNEAVKKMSEQYQGMVKNAMETDLNLRVSCVKSIRPNTTGNYAGNTDAPGDFFVDLVVEYAPGLWRDPITVPMEVLERVDTGANWAPVPDSLKRKSKIHKPEEIKTDGEKYNLSKKNTVLAGTKEPKDGRSQAAKPKPYKESTELEDVYGNMLTESKKKLTETSEHVHEMIAQLVEEFEKYFLYPVFRSGGITEDEYNTLHDEMFSFVKSIYEWGVKWEDIVDWAKEEHNIILPSRRDIPARPDAIKKWTRPNQEPMRPQPIEQMEADAMGDQKDVTGNY